MELLATHLGADFDAFAATLVARRLHPEARLFFPGTPAVELDYALGWLSRQPAATR
jgi:hypothetical protein